MSLRSLIAAALTATLAVAQGNALPSGVTPELQAVANRGLEWLARHQASDGSWRNHGAHGGYPVAMTSLAGMAFVTAGSTPTRGKYWRQVRDAVDYVLKQADPTTGLLANVAEDSQPMFAHGFATLLLASVYGMEEDRRQQERLKRVLDRAIALIASAQSPAGGWYYQPTDNTDEGSVTVTQMQALRACRMAGLVVDKRVVDRAIGYIERCQNDDGGIRYRLGMAGESRPAITAAGLAVLHDAGVADDSPFVQKAMRYCQQHVRATVDTTGHHFYTQLYWSQVLYRRGERPWAVHQEQLGDWLRQQQRADGSWEGDAVGPVYGTAVASLILHLPYAYVPIYQR